MFDLIIWFKSILDYFQCILDDFKFILSSIRTTIAASIAAIRYPKSKMIQNKVVPPLLKGGFAAAQRDSAPSIYKNN